MRAHLRRSTPDIADPECSHGSARLPNPEHHGNDQVRMSSVDNPIEIRYAAVGDADGGYGSVGGGALDLLYCYGLGGHIELIWEIPSYAQVLSRLASFSRLILFDRRGVGASDAVPHSAVPTWEELAEDVGAVLDAAGSSQAAVMATLDAGPMAILFAAMHPERVRALVLLNTTARYSQADDYPPGASPDAVDTVVAMLAAGWGTEAQVGLANPSRADDAEYLRLGARMLRASATPRSVQAQYEYVLRSDVRSALPLIHAPTLVLHVRDNFFLPLAHGQYLAEHIPEARLLEIPGGDIALNAIGHSVLDELGQFLTGEHPIIEFDRVLTTILFTDIVGSTQRAASLGDKQWRTLLDAHDRAVREEFRRFRGKEIKHTGDGFMASFDGPARAIRCAQSTIESARSLGIKLRVGLHTGECEVRGHDLGGLTVHIAARIGALADPGHVFVSATVKDLVAGSGIEFVDRGTHDLKGVPGSWALLSVKI